MAYTPIFKSGDKSSVKNYRPISLLCTISKVLERLVFICVADHVADYISNCQFGFTKGRSSQQQLLIMLDTIYTNFENKIYAYLDLKKAFDSVDHNILLSKLQSMGITGQLLACLEAYLADRQQLVSIHGEFSGLLPVTSGVPQGSLLGPLLFSVYINDLPDSVHLTKPLLFADDSKCLGTVRDRQISSPSDLQLDLDSLSLWSLTNRIAFNGAKCVLLSFPHGSAPPSHFISGVEIPLVYSTRDLGVLITDTLSWSDHIHLITSKAYKMLGLIRRSFAVSVSNKKSLYVSLVKSHLLYCSVIWRPHLRKDIMLLERVQRRASKFLLNDYSSDYKSRLISIAAKRHSVLFKISSLSNFCF